MTAAPKALVEQIAQFLHDEGGLDEAWSHNHSWPEHPEDTGQRDGGFVKIVPSDVQEKFREIAGRMVRGFRLDTLTAQLAEAEAEIARLKDPMNYDWVSVEDMAFESARDAGEDLSPGDFMEVSANRSVGSIWVASVIVARDENGNVDETRIEVFTTLAECEAALASERKS